MNKFFFYMSYEMAISVENSCTGCFRKNVFFKLALMTLLYVRMYINSTKSESPHYDI